MKAIYVATFAVLLAGYASPGQEAGQPTQVPFLLAKPRPNSGDFTETAFDPSAIRSRFQQVSAPVNTADLELRHFPISSAAFYANVRKASGEPDVFTGFKELAWKAGVDLSPPKTIFVSEGFGMLSVNATAKDLDKIKAIVDGLHCPPQQVHIKARFIEIPQKIFAELQEQSLQQGMSNGIARLTSSQASVFLNELQWQKDVKELAEPEVTTISGRPTQMHTTAIQPVVSNFAPASPTLDPQVVRVETAGGYFYAGHDSIHPQVGKIETGPVLDVVALTPPDGYTISLCVTASDAQFLDYQASTQQAIYDGQTLVLFPSPQQEVFDGQEERAQKREVADFYPTSSEERRRDKVLVALVTATMIDPAGNRTHSDEEIPSGLPPPWP